VWSARSHCCCDMVVATAVLPHDRSAIIEPGVIDFLNGERDLGPAQYGTPGYKRSAIEQISSGRSPLRVNRVGTAYASKRKGLRCQKVTSRAFGDKGLFRKVSKNGNGGGSTVLARTGSAREVRRPPIAQLQARTRTTTSLFFTAEQSDRC
jgi:hypothetical protein